MKKKMLRKYLKSFQYNSILLILLSIGFRLLEGFEIPTSNRSYVSTLINTEQDKRWNGNFSFIHAADPQLGLKDYYKNPNYKSATANLTFELELCEKAVNKANEMNPKPKFFLVNGDLINESNKPQYSHELKSKQIEAFKLVFSKLDKDIPLIYSPGNHDIGDSPTNETIQTYRNNFGDDYFSFWCGGVFFVVLNSQLQKNRQHTKNIAQEQDKWLKEQLKGAAGSRIVCFWHIPVFVNHLKEKETIFNLPVNRRKRILKMLYDAGVRHLFNGHYHRNASVRYKDMKIVITSAIGLQFGKDHSGFGIVNVTQNDIDYRYVKLDN